MASSVSRRESAQARSTLHEANYDERRLPQQAPPRLVGNANHGSCYPESIVNAETLARINKAIAAANADGTLARIMTKYGR
jgi:ABC-type amino acid transport substrate-binding protein